MSFFRVSEDSWAFSQCNSGWACGNTRISHGICTNAFVAFKLVTAGGCVVGDK